MSNGKDNTARKKTQADIEAENIDAGWEQTDESIGQQSHKTVEKSVSYINELVEGALEGAVEPISKRFVLKEKKQSTLPGSQLLNTMVEEKSVRGKVFVESGEAKPVNKNLKIENGTVMIRSLPGSAKEKDGKMVYPTNRDGIAIHEDDLSGDLTIGLVHAGGHQTKDRILANVAATDLAYLLAARRGQIEPQPPLIELSKHLQTTVVDMNSSFKQPTTANLPITIARLSKNNKLEVLNAGDNHSLIIHRDKDSSESIAVQTMEEKIMEEHPEAISKRFAAPPKVNAVTAEDLERMDRGITDAEMYGNYLDSVLDKGGSVIEEPHKVLTEGLGVQSAHKEFQPKTETFKVSTGDAIVILSGAAMEALKLQDPNFLDNFRKERANRYVSQSKFADDYFGRYILDEMKSGKKLEQIIDDLLKKVSQYSELDIKNQPTDTSLTIIGYSVPAQI